MGLLVFDDELTVISGMQNGVDQAALFAAKKAGITTGGYAPVGYKTLDGCRPDIGEAFGLVALETSSYSYRTEMNVMNSDATLQIAYDLQSAGELCTTKAILKHQKPYYVIQVENCYAIDSHLRFTSSKYSIDSHHVNGLLTFLSDVRKLNVAGNSEKTAPGIQIFVEDFLVQIFKQWREK